MADRGRKAYPVSSHLCDERWQRHCMDLHKQRLSDMKGRIDNTKPETYDMVLSKGKRAMLDKERQTEVDRENAILLQKMVRIKEQDTREVFRPWTARSTFQWKTGHYYDPATGTKTLDHINLTSSASPRSIHYFATRPGTAPPDVTARLRDMQIQVDNTKLLRAITTMRSRYDVDDMEKRHVEESVMLQRISNYRGPDGARYQPPGRSISASRPSSRSPYVTGGPLSRPGTSGGRSSKPFNNYLEEAQSMGIPPPTGRMYSGGGSRPTTAAIPPRGSQEGLGETSPPSHSPRQPSLSGGASEGRHSRAGSVLASGPASAHGSRPGSSTRPGAGGSFSFGAAPPQQEEAVTRRSSGRPASASGDGYEDEQYEAEEEADEGREQARASGAGSSRAGRASGGSGRGAADEGQADDGDAAGSSYGDEDFDQEAAQEAAQEEEEERQQGGEEERGRRSGEAAAETSASHNQSGGKGRQEQEEGGEEEAYGEDGFEAEQEAGSERGEEGGEEGRLAQAESEAEGEPEEAVAASGEADAELDIGYTPGYTSVYTAPAPAPAAASEPSASSAGFTSGYGKSTIGAGGFAADWD